MTDKRIAQLMRWNLNPDTEYYGEEWLEVLKYISKLKRETSSMRIKLRNIQGTERNYKIQQSVHLAEKVDGVKILKCGKKDGPHVETTGLNNRVTCKRCMKFRIKRQKKIKGRK